MNAELIPAISEAEATGETAALFADLRQTLRVPFVNLIWRHLATIPGGLQWTWSLLRPVYVDPALEQAARGLTAGIVLRHAPLERFVLEAAGIPPADQAAIGTLVADYNRGNQLNFLALTLACRILRGATPPGAASAPPGAVAPPASQPAPSRRLLGLDELSPPVLALVLDLDRFGRIAPSDAVASLYRHLAHWPGFLALAHTALLPQHRDGTLRVQQEALIASAAPIVETRLLQLLPSVPAPLGPASEARVLAGLDEFTRLMIGRMVVLGEALLGLLPGSGTRAAEP